MAKYVLTRYCNICKTQDRLGFDTRKEYAEASKNTPNPYYCYDCDPSRLHGDELVEFAKSMIGIRFFGLSSFRTFASYNAIITTVSHVEVDQTVTYHKGSESAKIGWTRIYFPHYRGEYVWESPEKFRKIHLVTDDDVAEIVGICNERMTRFMGYTKDEQIAGYTRIINDVSKSRDYYIL